MPVQLLITAWGMLADGEVPKLKVRLRLNLHGVVSVESVQQVEEEEYEEVVVVKKPPPAAAKVPVLPTILSLHACIQAAALQRSIHLALSSGQSSPAPREHASQGLLP